MRILEELAKDPPKEIIKTNEDNKGEYLPILWIEEELDRIFGKNGWDSDWFQAPRMIAPNTISTAVSLVIHPNDEMPNGKKGIGTALKIVDMGLNNLPSPRSMLYSGKIVKSIAIANAAKMLGRRFGRYLNRDDEKDESQYRENALSYE